MKNILIKSFAVLATGFMLGSCEENAIEDFNEPAKAGAFIKFAHAAPAAPAVNFYLDNAKISAVAASSSGKEQGLGYGSNSIFPTSYGYANVEAGNHTLQAIDTVSAGGSADMIANAAVSLGEGSRYTAFLIGAPGAYETYVVEDKLPEENYTKSHIRFVNLIQNAPSDFDVTVVRKATTVDPEVRTTLGTDIVTKGKTDYVAMDPQGSFTVEFATTGATGEAITIKSSSFSPIAGRAYTIILRGDYTGATTSTVLFRDR